MVVKNDISLQALNTFGIDAKAHYFAEITSVSGLDEARLFVKNRKIPLLILGGGSNVLFTRDFEGLLLSNGLQGIETIKEAEEFLWIKVMGGQSWSEWVDYCVELGLGGIENLSGIPGTVGAAPIQNIGAYGVEVKDVVEEVEVFNVQTGELSTYTNKRCAFGYRSSVFKTSLKGNYFVVSVTFKLSKNPKVNVSYAPLKEVFEGRNTDTVSVKEVSEAVKHIRKWKLPDPSAIGNAGSFFKNPVVDDKKLERLLGDYPNMPRYPFGSGYKLAAGWLIEQCGWKGKRVGHAGIHEKQALVVVNHGNASGKEILNLAEEVRHSVEEKFGVGLEFEVNVV